MSNALRILFISGEVTPFTPSSEIGGIVRTLPEQLHESGKYETRIMMPRYGIISERRNRLHEVIRLSGSEIAVDDQTQTLKVKVASIPGIRLQVYFMDNVHFFKRKGIVAGKDGVVFPDNAERSMYFCKAAFETIKNLGWQPDLVHSFGWASSFAPLLLKSELAEEPLFQSAKIVYTPDRVNADPDLTADRCEAMGLPSELVGKTLDEIGSAYADAVIHPASANGSAKETRFGKDPESFMDTANPVYEQLVGVTEQA
ncbi:MAG: glycogen/starch synthase [Bacteroidetes bacterium]|nr:glycogen/starch synthase [Bacteroidota bacterium]